MLNIKSITTSVLLSTTISASALAGSTITDGSILVGTDLSYPPYNYIDENGAPAGFDVELMTALAKRTELNITFLDTKFENLILGVNGQQFDVIASTLYVKPERAKKIDYVPYMKTGVSIAVASSSGKSFATLNDLCGQVVGSIKGAAWLEAFEEMNTGICAKNPIDSREFPTSPEATQALLSGGVDAQVEDSAVLGAAVDKLNGRLVISSKEQFYPVIVGLGVKKNNEALVNDLRVALKGLEEDGTYTDLLKKYNLAKPSEEEFLKAVGQ